MVTEEGTRFLLLTFVTYTHREVSIKENTLVFLYRILHPGALLGLFVSFNSFCVFRTMTPTDFYFLWSTEQSERLLNTFMFTDQS